MNIEFKICKYDTCGLTITGLEREGASSYPEQSEIGNYSEYSFEDSVTINFLIPVNKKNQDEVPYQYYEIVEHIDGEDDRSIMTFPKDGLFKIVHLILPTSAWYAKQGNIFPSPDHPEEEEGSNNSSKKICFYHGDPDDKTYPFGFNIPIPKTSVNSEIEYTNISIEELLENNYDTVFKGVQYTFNICNLETCFYEYALQYLTDIDFCNTAVCKERDLAFISIHILKYLIDLGKYFEALELIEKIHGCNGICKLIKTYNLKTDCGCGC